MKYLPLFLSLLWVQPLFAQSNLPVIRATSKKVAIDDGGYLDKNAWNLSPKTRPDIFTADRTRKAKWVTFYTDIDSIRVRVKPGSKFDFIVLLNGKDSCYTRIASAIAPETMQKSKINTHDTIPFTLTAYNIIHVRSVINDTDTLNLHFDLGSFDFDLTKDAILKKTKLLSNQPDALAGRTAPDYNKLNKVAKIQIGKIVWNNPEVMPTGVTAQEMDGRFGWNLFEGKVVEIDYDNNLLIIHSALPGTPKGYQRSKLEFIRSFVCVKGTFAIKNKRYTGSFLLDTGSGQAVILDSAWAGEQDFPKDLEHIGTLTFRDPRGIKYETSIMQSPLLEINNFGLANVPTYVLNGKNPTGFEINYLGNDLLKRFNMILDLKNDYIYLKPNRLMTVKYRGNS